MAVTRTLLRQALPWVVSGASGLYIMRRARQLSVAEASAETLVQFVVRQGDLVLVVTGNPMVWYIVRRPQHARDGILAGASAVENGFHQLRQVFTIATLGVEILRRRLQAGNTASMLQVLTVLRRVLSNGRIALVELEQAYYSEAKPTNMTARGTHDADGAQPQR